MERFDGILQTVLAVAAITAVNHFVYHEGVLVSIGYAAAITACFWLGRLSVRLIRRTKQLGRAMDE